MRHTACLIPSVLALFLSSSLVLALPDASKQDEPFNNSDVLTELIIDFYPDSSEVQKRFLPLLSAHADYLVNHREQTIVIAGHVAGENGAKEYDIALGEQLAKSVERILRSIGVNSDQVTVISYGRERPRCLETTAACKQLNNFVSIIYR